MSFSIEFWLRIVFFFCSCTFYRICIWHKTHSSRFVLRIFYTLMYRTSNHIIFHIITHEQCGWCCNYFCHMNMKLTQLTFIFKLMYVEYFCWNVSRNIIQSLSFAMIIQIIAKLFFNSNYAITILIPLLIITSFLWLLYRFCIVWSRILLLKVLETFQIQLIVSRSTWLRKRI